MESKYEIKLSGFGRDLVAREDIRQGETVLRLPSVSLAQADMYSIEAWPGLHLDCSQGFAGAINHSCSPNAAVRDGKIVAWSCIKAGDSITIDYKRTEEKLAVPFDCVCGAKNCRGRIE